MDMSSGISASPSRPYTATPQHGGLCAEHSAASVAMPAAAHQHPTPAQHSHHEHIQAGQGFSAMYQQSSGAQQAAQGAVHPAGAGVHVGSWGQEAGNEQLGSPGANAASGPADGQDTPKTLQLKAMAAQAERLKQVLDG